MEPQLSEINDQKEVKIVIVGDANVGKTSLLVRFTDDEFSDAIVNIAVDFKEYIYNYEGEDCKVLIWDTAGQERYRTITSTFYRDTEAVILMYDITDNSSFNNLDKWLQEIDTNIPYSEKIIVGHKLDLESERKIDKSDGEAYCEQKSIRFIEASAKANTNIKQIFEDLLKDVLSKKLAKPKKKGVSIRKFETKKVDRKRSFSFCVI